MERLCFRGMMKTVWLLATGGILCCLLAAGCRTTGVDIVQYGTYEAKEKRSEASGNTTRGMRVMLGDIELVEQTDTVSGKVGTRFGFFYSVTGSGGNDLDATITGEWGHV